MTPTINIYLKGILITLFTANAAAMLVALLTHASKFGAVGTTFSWQLFIIKLVAHVTLIVVNLVAVAELMAMPSEDA